MGGQPLGLDYWIQKSDLNDDRNLTEKGSENVFKIFDQGFPKEQTRRIPASDGYGENGRNSDDGASDLWTVQYRTVEEYVTGRAENDGNDHKQCSCQDENRRE